MGPSSNGGDQRLNRITCENFPNSEDILEKLISFETVNGNEAACAQWIAHLLDSLGMNVSLQDLGNARANVFARIGRGHQLLLCGHLDVVPAQGAWTTPPFELVKENGFYFGRGCADMKGAIAAMISAARQFLVSDEPLQKGFALLFVADEEKDNLGTTSFLRKQIENIKYCVIGEPTDLQIAVAHKGVARFRITVHGKSTHSSIPHEGVNAIQGAALLVTAIGQEDNSLSQTQHRILPPPSLNVTVLHAGEQDNIIPGEASMIVDYRLLPGTSYNDALAKIEAIVGRVQSDHPAFGFSILKHAYCPGGEVSPDEYLVKKCCIIAEESLRGEFKPQAFPATCEQALFVNAGISTVICGPGNISQAHTVNEFLLESQLIKAEKLYSEMIRTFNRE